MIIFFITTYFAFLIKLLLSILHKQLSSSFQLFDRSRLPFRLVFDNLSKSLIIYPQYLDVFMISNRPFTTLKFKPNLSPYTHNYPTPCYLRLKRFLAVEFLKNSKFCCRSNVNDLSQLIYLYLL